MKQNFIQVFDKNTADKLMDLGFQLVSNSNNTYMFLNTDKIQFSDEIDITKIKYSNLMYI